MSFVPWWRGEFLRGRTSSLGWGLISLPVICVVVVWLLFPARVGEIPSAVPVFLAAAVLGCGLLVLERYLRPRHHHAQVLYVEVPDVKPYYYSICDCRWFGGVTDDAAAAFGDARKHTDHVDDEVVRVFNEPKR